MSENEDRPLWQQIRDAVAEGHVYYLNVPKSGDTDTKEYVNHIIQEGILTLGDWRLYDEAGTRFARDDEVVTSDTVTDHLADPMAGRIDWDGLRDTLHEAVFAERGTKVRAGQVVAGIRRFVDEMSEGDLVLVGLPSGVVPAVIEGPPRYSLSSRSYELTSNQAFYRDVTWGRGTGGLIEIPRDSLPPGFGPGRQTVGKISDPSLVVALLQGLEWMGEQL